MSGRFVMLFSLLVPLLSFTGTPAYAQKFSCGSNNNQYQMCQIPGNGNPQNVRMVRQLSQSPCIQGRTWGTRGNQVWVDKGCRAEFQVAGYGGPGYGGGYHGGPPRGGPPAYYSGSFSDGRSNCTSGAGLLPKRWRFQICESRSCEQCVRTKSNLGRFSIRTVGRERL